MVDRTLKSSYYYSPAGNMARGREGFYQHCLNHQQGIWPEEGRVFINTLLESPAGNMARGREG